MANVKVAVRVRPICKREEDAKATIVVNEYQENVLGVANPKIEGIEGCSDHRDRIKHFSFDYCYFSLDKNAPNYASQQTIFNDLGSEVLDSSFDGYNVCLFAYGQTGSGKTYTMMGDEAEQGVIPRLCESLLGRVSSYEEDVTFKVEVSFLEIYNERVRDLLAPPNKAKYSLKVREHPKDGPYVQDLSHHLVSDYEQVLSLMHDGNLQRTTAATHMHELSSRSHAIFTITFIQAKMSHGMPSEIVSKINLVDLAGSERASINSSKDRLQEGANINKSLVTLGNCIQALGPQMDLSKSLPETWLTARQKRGEEMLESAADSALTAASMESLSMSEDWDALSGPRRRTNYVPYRNSILTWLLKDSLGGNSKTIMIATISPASIHYNETMSTLRYAKRAKHIVNQPIVNEDRNVRLIRELRAEIDRLRMLLNSASLASSQASLIQDQNICRMLQENEQRVDQLTEAWVEKWSNAARIMQECNVGIRKESVGVIVESELPHLIGMDDDLLSTGIILYHLKEGRTKIGRENPDNHQDIVLYGPDVEDEHAVIINTDGHVVLTPLRNSKCAVNGLNIHRPVELTQGAVILLGSTNMFRFNHPAEAVKLRERRASRIPGRGLRRALSAEFGKRISLSMSLDGSWSAEPESNLKKTPMRSSFSDLSSDISPIMMFNPGLELERRHKLEAEKLEDTRKQLAELEAKRAEAEAAQQEQESMMERSLHEHQERIREQKELIERLKKEHQEAMALAQEELVMMKGKISSQKEMGKQKLEGELTQLKEVPSYHSDLCTIPSVVSNVCSDTEDLLGLDIARKRVALMELLQKQSQRKALAALERRQATLEVQERTAQLILKHEEQKLQDFETDPRLLEGEFGSEQSPEKELGERNKENTVDSSTENVSAELPASGRVSPVGNSDPETMHYNNLHSPKKEAKRVQKQDNKDLIIDQRKDQSTSKKSSRKGDTRPARKVDLGLPKTKSREELIKKESNGQSASPSRSTSPSKSSQYSSPSKSSRASSPTKSIRSDSPTKSLRSDSPTKSSRSSSPASSTSRKSRQTSGNVFSRLYPQQETKFDYLRKKSPPRYAEHDPHRERHRDSPHLIRRELSPVEHDPIKLKDRKHDNIQDNKHVRTSSVPSSNLPDRTKQNLYSRSRTVSPSVNKPVKPVARSKKSPSSQSSQETEKAGSRARAKSKDTANAPHGRTHSDPVTEKDKCQTKTKKAHQATPNESTHSSPTKRKTNHPENASNVKTPKGSSASPSRSRPVISKAVVRSSSPKKKSEQTPSHRKTVKRPFCRSRNGKDGENTNSPSPRRKFARTPVVKPKNWPSLENLPKSTPISEAFYVPLTSEQLRLELQKHASEQDSGPHLEGGDLGTAGCEQHWSPSRKRSVGKRPEQTQTNPIQDGTGGEIFDFKMSGVNSDVNEENDYSSSESFVDSLEDDLKRCHDRRAEGELKHGDGPRVVDMTSADEDEFWAIPVSSEDILTASSDGGEDDDEDDIALNLDIHGNRKQSSDTLESVNSNDELEEDDPCHTTMVKVENPEELENQEQGSASPEIDTGKRILSDDSLGSEQFHIVPVVSDHKEAQSHVDNLLCDMEHAGIEPIHLHVQTQKDGNEGSEIVEIVEFDENQDRPTEAGAETFGRPGEEVSERDHIESEEDHPKSDEIQLLTDVPCEDEMSPEPSNSDVKFEKDIVGTTDEEAEACEKDKDGGVSKEDHMESEKETPQLDVHDTSDIVPQEPLINEVHSMPDLPDEDVFLEPSPPSVTVDKEIKKSSAAEDESYQVSERNEQETTEEGPLSDIANITDQKPSKVLNNNKIISLTDLPDEYIDSELVDPNVMFDYETFVPTDAQKEACEKNGDNDIPEIKLKETCERSGNEVSERDHIESEGECSESDEMQLLTDMLGEDEVSPEPSNSDVKFEKEVFGITDKEAEACEKDKDGEVSEEDHLESEKETPQFDVSDKSDTLPQGPLINEVHSMPDLPDDDVSAEPSHPSVTVDKEIMKPSTEDESYEIPEKNEQETAEEGPLIYTADVTDQKPSKEFISNKILSGTDLPDAYVDSVLVDHDVIFDNETFVPTDAQKGACETHGDNDIPEIKLKGTCERSGNEVSERDHIESELDSPENDEIQLLTYMAAEDGVCPEPSNSDVQFEKEMFGTADKEAEACEKDKDGEVSEEDHMESEKETPQFDVSDTSDTLPQRPLIYEVRSLPDLHDEDVSSEPSPPSVTVGKEIKKPSAEDESYEVLERNEQEAFKEGPISVIADIKDEKSFKELKSDKIFLRTDLPDEYIDSETVDPYVMFDNETFGRTDAQKEACEKHGDSDIPEIKLKYTEQYPDMDINDTEQHLPQEQYIRGGHQIADFPDEGSSSESSHDSELSRLMQETEASEEDHNNENLENPVENALEIGEVGLQIDISASMDHLPEGQEKDSQIGICHATNPLHQDPIINEMPSLPDIPKELPTFSHLLHPDILCEEEVAGPTDKTEVGKKDEPVKVSEREEQKNTEQDSQRDISYPSDIPQEPHINEIQSMTVLPSSDSTSPVFSHSDVTCDNEIDPQSEVCKKDRDDDVPERNEVETAEEHLHIDISAASHQLPQEETHINQIHSTLDLPDEHVYSEPFHPDVTCDQQGDGPPIDANAIGFAGKPDNTLDRMTDEETPKSEEYIDQHPEWSSLKILPESHPGASIAVEFASHDLEPSVCEDERSSSVDAEEKEFTKEGTNPIHPIDSPEDNHEREIETEMNGTVHGDIPEQFQVEGVCTEGHLRDNAVSIEKETANCEVALPTSPCPVKNDKDIHDITNEVPNDFDGCDVNTGMSGNNDDDVTGDEQGRVSSFHIDGASPEDIKEEQFQETVPIVNNNDIPDISRLQSPDVNNGPILLEKQGQDEVNDKEQSPELATPLITIQSDADEIPAVSCTVMANQLNQLQRPVIVNLSTLEYDASDSDEGSSDLVSDDQSETSEEEIKISGGVLLDQEYQSPEESVPENRDQQRPVGSGKDLREMLPEQEPVSSVLGPDTDKLKECENFIALGTNKPLHSVGGVHDVPLTDGTIVGSQFNEKSIPTFPDEELKVKEYPVDRIDEKAKAMRQPLPQENDNPTVQSLADREGQKIVYGPSDMSDLTKSHKSTSQQLHQLPKPHGNGESKVYSNNHNFRVSRASPVPFSDEEMESMESPSSCSSPSAVEYRFDEEQTLSDFLEDANEIDNEEAAMSDDMSALQNSEVNGEITDGSQDNGSDNTSSEPETGLGVPEAITEGTLPSIQASLPPNVYRSLVNAVSPLKRNILTNSIADGTLPDESALYQSAMDTSLYQTAVESPSAFSSKIEIIPFKKTWHKDQILAYSTPTGTPKGTPVAKTSKNLDQKEYCPPLIDQHGGSPSEHKQRFPPQLGASPSSTMAGNMPVSPPVTMDLHGNAGPGDTSAVPATDHSVCIGDISTDTKSDPNFHPEISSNKRDDENGEEMRGLYRSPHDLPEQSYILHTLETIQEEDSMAEDSECEDTCSTLHSNSPQNSRGISPNLEHMSVSSPVDINPADPQNMSPTLLTHVEIMFSTKGPLDEEISAAHSSETLQSEDQEVIFDRDETSRSVENAIEPNEVVPDGNDMDSNANVSQEYPTSKHQCLENEDLISTTIKPHLREHEMPFPENPMAIKQETTPANVDGADEQNDVVSESKGSETCADQPESIPVSKMTPDNEDVISIVIPPAYEKTDMTLLPEKLMSMQASTADDFENTDRITKSDPDCKEMETSVKLPEAISTSKRKDVFSRLYPRNVPKFDFKRKSAATVIPKGRSPGNVSPKIRRKDLKARKADLTEADTDGICDKNLDAGHSNSKEDVACESPFMTDVLTDSCDKTSEAGNQRDDTSGTFEVCCGDPAAVSADKDHISENILESESEQAYNLDDKIADDGATNETDLHENDEDTNNDIPTLSPDKYADAHETQAAENLKPFLGKDYAIASAKLTMFMRMFGLSVESTDSSESSDSLRLHRDRGLVDRIVGDGVGYDPDTFQCNDSLTNTLSGSPGSIGHKGGETLPDDECGDETLMGSDVAVDGDSSVRELRSLSTTTSDAELMSGGDDTVTDSTSAMFSHDIEEDQKLGTISKHLTNLPRIQPESCITRSMQLTYPKEDIACTLSKLDIEVSKSTNLSLKGDSNINKLPDSSSSEMGKLDNLNSDVHEFLEVDFKSEIKPVESCKDRDHNHNLDALQELRIDGDAPATPYRKDDFMLLSATSVANQQVPVQIEESVMTPSKMSEVKHPDLCVDDVGKSRSADKHEPTADEDEYQYYTFLSSEKPDSVPCLTPRVTEVIHASKVQLEENMVSSVQRLKDVFAKGDGTPREKDRGLAEEPSPSTEFNVEAKDGESEMPFTYVGVHEGPINYTSESDDFKPLQRHVSDKITANKVKMAKMCLPSPFEKAEENNSSHEITLKEKDVSEPQVGEQNDQSPVQSQSEGEQPIYEEDEAMTEQDLLKHQISENCTKEPIYLPELTLPAVFSKLDEWRRPLSQQRSLGESKREGAFKPEQKEKINSNSAPVADEQEQRRTLDEDHNQQEPSDPVADISTQTDHNLNRAGQPLCDGDRAIAVQLLPKVHVSETFTKNLIHHPEQSLSEMLSNLAESEGHLSQQSSLCESKKEDTFRPEERDMIYVDPDTSATEGEAQQRTLDNHLVPISPSDDNNQSNTAANEAADLKQVQPMKIILKKDQGMNTDEAFGVHVNWKRPAENDAILIPPLSQRGVNTNVLSRDKASKQVTTKEVSHALCSTRDDLGQTDSNICKQEPNAEQQVPFKMTAHEEPFLVRVAYPSSDEPVKWHLLSVDSNNYSTHPHSFKDSVVTVTPAVDKSTQCQAADIAEAHSNGNLDILVPHERVNRSTSPGELADIMHSFKPITPSPRLIIAASQVEPSCTQVEELNKDFMENPLDIGKKNECPSSELTQSTVLLPEAESVLPKENLHKETQSDLLETTSSLQVPPLQVVDGVSPAYSPLLSSRSTDDELAQIFAAAKQRAPVKHMFTNTSPEIQAARRSIADASTTTDDSFNEISNKPVQDMEEITTTACAQTSPFETLMDQRLVLDASTTTDDSLKLISNDPVQDTDGITSTAVAQTFLCEELATTACVQTSPFKELGNSKEFEMSYRSTTTETVALTPPIGPSFAVDSSDADFVVNGDGDGIQQPTCYGECVSENRSKGTSQLNLPQVEHFSPLNIKTSTPNTVNVDEQESQANLSSQSNNQECQTDLSPSALSSPSSTADGASGPWRRASEVLDELSGNMDSEELELFAVLMHKRRLSEQTVDRVKGLAAKLRKSNQSNELAFLNSDLESGERPHPNPVSTTTTSEEISSPKGNSSDILGSIFLRQPQHKDAEKCPDQNKAVLTLSPLPLSETGTREFDLGDIEDVPVIENINQQLKDHEEENDTSKNNLGTMSPVDGEFLTLPGQNGSMSPPLVPSVQQSPSMVESYSPRSGLPFDRKPTPPTKTLSERSITDRRATYSKAPVRHVMGTCSRNDWHSMPLQSAWDEPLNKNNNSSTDYSEDDIGSGEIAVDSLLDDPLKQDSVGSKHSSKVTLSTFSDVSFDSELDFPVGTKDQKEGSVLDKKDEVKNQTVNASMQSLDSDLFADSAEPELLALQADTDDSNALTGSLPADFNHSNGFVEENQGEVKDDQEEVEDKLKEAESFRIHMPPISPAKLEWLLAESESEPDVSYLPLSKHPEKDKIPLPGFKHQSTEGPFVIEKQPNEALMLQVDGKIHPQGAELEAYPVKFAMDNQQKGTIPSARSRHVPSYMNQIPNSSSQYPGVTLPPTGNRHGNLERTGSSLGESSGIYSLASELLHQHQVKTPSGSMDSLINAPSTDEERDMQQLQSEYERLLQGRNSSSLHPVNHSGPMNLQQANSLKGPGDGNKNTQPHSNGIFSGYSSGDSASSSEIDGFVYGHYSQSMDRRDISIELLEAQVMHGIGETDALLKFLDDDLPLEYWKNRKSQTKPQHGETEHGKPTADKREMTQNPNTGTNKSPVYQFRRSLSSSLRKSPSGPQSSRSSPSSTTPPPLQRVVTPLLRASPTEQSPSPKGRFKPSEHLKFLRRVRENVVKATANPTSPTPSTPSPRPQLYSMYPTEAPSENLRTSSSFNLEKNDMELFLNELREARKMSQSEIAKAEKELHPSRRRYSAGEDAVFADATQGTHQGGEDFRNHPASAAEKDGDRLPKQKTQRSDEDIIDREIAYMRAAAAVILPSTATSLPGTSSCKEGEQLMEESLEGSPSKPYYYEMYNLPSRAEPTSKNLSQGRPQSQFGYCLYKDPPRSHAALTNTYPPSTSSLQGDDPKKKAAPLHQSGSIQLQKYTPLKSTGSSSSLPAPPKRRSTPQPSGVYLSVPQHKGVSSPQGGDSLRSYRGSPGSQVKISPVKSNLRNRRQHAGKAFQELPTVRESKLVWSRPECHLVAETALQTLVSEMAPCESFDPHKSHQPDEEGGWRYEGSERDILLLSKTHSPASPINSYAGIGIIKAPARTVFNYVKDPTSRQLYDPMLKEVKVKKDFGGDLQVVYMVFKTDQCLLQHPRDCLCVIKTLEMDDRFLVVAASVKHPRIPHKKKTIRAEVLLAGCCIQPLQTENMEHCRVTHLSQVNLHGDLQPKLINALSSRLPMCIADLRNIVQIGDV